MGAREKINLAFLEELKLKKSLRKVTVTGICQRAQVNRSTFYQYFLDVEDLWEQLSLELVNRFHRETITILKDRASLTQEKLAEVGVHFFKENGELLLTLLTFQESNSFSQALIQKMLPLFTALLAPMPEEKARVLMVFQLSGLIGVLQEWYLGHTTLSLDEMVPFLQEQLNAPLRLLLPLKTEKNAPL